jgi:hypothetical protein
MRANSLTIVAALACAFAASGAVAQSGIPQIVLLPDDDFVFTWGKPPGSLNERQRPDFTIRGVEQSFQCTLTGAFKVGSRMRDFYNIREFEQSLAGTLYFVQEATARLNQLDLSNDLDWALMNCVIPETFEEDDRLQERVDKALERAERQRDRRRARDADSDD